MLRSVSIAGVALTVAFVNACGGGDRAVGPGPGDDTQQSFQGCAVVQSISVGSSVSGSLTSSDCRLPIDNSFIDYYELRLGAATTVTVVMTSSAFDAFLIVFDRASGNVIDADDDGGGGTDALLQITLSAGTYIVGANSFEPGQTGAYQLSVN